MNANTDLSAPRPKRRWLPRFGLRTLLILVALIGAGFGYLGHLYRRVHHQRQIVAKIEEAGGTVRYEWQLGGLREDAIGRLVRTKNPPGPAFLRWALGDDIFAYVAAVDFNRYSHPAQALDPALLLELPRLRVVGLVGPQVSDEWLKCVAKIPQLKVLALWGGPQSTKITDVGLAAIARNTQIEHLALDRTGITDDGLLQLRTLTNLKDLMVQPQVTKQAAQELQKSLPQCQITDEDQNGAFVLAPN